MKRFAKGFGCAMLFLALLCCGTAALGEGHNADFLMARLIAQEEGSNRVEYLSTAAAAGDALYVLTDRALYAWQDGMAEPQTLFVFPRPQDMEDEWEENAPSPQPTATPDPMEAVLQQMRYSSSKLFSDGKRLLAMMVDTWDTSIPPGSVWQLTDETGALKPALEATLEYSAFGRPEEGYTYYPDIKGIQLMDGFLYLVAVDYEKSQTPSLYRWEMATGKAGKELPCQITSMTPYKDGLFLCVLVDPDQRDRGEWPMARLATFSPQTNAFVELFDLGKVDEEYLGLGYNPENDTAYYLKGTMAYSLPGMSQPAKISAYFINRIWESMGCGLMEGGLYYQAGYDGVSVRQLDPPGLEEGALDIYGVYGGAAHVAFAVQHPEIPTALHASEYYATLDAFVAAMVSGQGTDVLQIFGSGAPVQQLIDKGYAMDLSGNAEIMAAVNAMYPEIADRYRRDGSVYGLPVSAYVNSIGYNQPSLEELGLTPEDLPRNWMEFLDFVANWPEDYGEDHPDIYLLEDMDVKESLLYFLMETYVAYSLKTWGRIDFGAPLFEKLMRAYEVIDPNQVNVPGEDGAAQENFWNQKHLFSRNCNYTDLQYSSPDSQWASQPWVMVPLPLPLDEGLEPVLPLSQEVMIINPRTTRPQQALLYVATTAQCYDKRREDITLFPDHNEPVPNPGYEEEQASAKKNLKHIEKVLETASPEDKAWLEESRKSLQDRLDNAEDYRYDVSPQAIAQYRDTIVPYLYVVGQTPLNTWRGGQENEFYVLMRQYLEGAIPLERFIKDMGGRVRMMELEDQ